jgi:hypothetical protein
MYLTSIVKYVWVLQEIHFYNQYRIMLLSRITGKRQKLEERKSRIYNLGEEKSTWRLYSLYFKVVSLTY